MSPYLYAIVDRVRIHLELLFLHIQSRWLNVEDVARRYDRVVVKYSPWFDSDWYLAHNLDVARSNMSALEHFVTYGWKECRDPGPLFSSKNFKKKNPSAVRNPLVLCFEDRTLLMDVNRAVKFPLLKKHSIIRRRHNDAKVVVATGLFVPTWYQKMYLKGAKLDPVIFFCEVGWRRGDFPCPEFDTLRYVQEYKLKGAGVENPVLNFARFNNGGCPRSYYPRLELYNPNVKVDIARVCPSLRQDVLLIEASTLWDGKWYSVQQKLAVEDGRLLVLHYLMVGWKSRALPSPEFDGNEYIKRHPEVGGMNPLVHYLKIGRKNKFRKPVNRAFLTEQRVCDLIACSAFFDVNDYRKYDSSFQDKDVNFLAKHYHSEGWKYGWNASKNFRTDCYFELNPDVRHAKMCPLEHYLVHGQYEGRAYAPCKRDARMLARLKKVQKKAEKRRIRRRSSSNRLLLLLTHEFSYTGAPLSLLKAAQCLRGLGFRIAVVSKKGGPLHEEFSRIAEVYVGLSDAELMALSMRCDTAIVNTLVLAHEYNLICSCIPTAWWIREPVSMLERYPVFKKTLMTAKTIYAMSPYSADSFKPYNLNIKVIRHGIDDLYRGVKIDAQNPVFAVIGTIQPRKGQDVFIEAIRQMRPDLRAKCRFFVVGAALQKSYEYEQSLRKQAGGSVVFTGARSDLQHLYEESSCVVIPSREEPTSRVAIEAMMFGRPVIMSDHVGARYLINDGNGRIFPSGDAVALCRQMEWMVEHPVMASKMESEARRAYLENNSIGCYTENLKTVLRDAIDDYQSGYGRLLRALEKISSFRVEPCAIPTLSIVIPVYNAFKEIRQLLRTIEEANFSQETEVIIVDDCSTQEVSSYLQSESDKRGYKFLRNDTNLGFVKTCNRGMRAAKGDVAVLLNSDTLVPPSFEEKVKDCFASDRHIACASPIAVHSGWFDFAIEDKNLFLHIAARLSTRSSTYPLFTPEGFCFCCRLSALKEVGLLDEVYGMGYSEEDDLVMRLILTKYRTVLIDNLLVYHKRHASFSSERRKSLYERNRLIFNSRYGNEQSVFRDRSCCKETVKTVSSSVMDFMNEVFASGGEKE